MSEPIQSIAQNNYILHNIDAKKLYVQEPLFTANSGDAVYVGWRPDETVLFDSSALISSDQALGTTFNISEPVSNFERFKVYYTRFPWTDQCPTHQIQEFDSTVPVNVIVLHTTFATSTATNPSWYDCTETITNISGTTWKLNACSQRQLPNGNLDSSWIYLKPYKIIGINRKENA